MVSRDDIGSWLDGNVTAGSAELQLPNSGPGSKASMAKRVIALCIDWGMSLVISLAFFDNAPMITLAIFAFSTFVLVATIGTTVGHRIVGIGVIRLAGQYASGGVGFVSGLVRTLLLCLVIPPAVWDQDGRGLHDKAAGTIIITTR